ncbi:MAG: gamma-glutamyltransferase family protein [Burkholderiales bacterium]
MLNPTRGTRGMAVASHALAAQSALDVLREGGNAIEAMIAAAATIAVAYPHMNSIGGDSFWLISAPGQAPRGIDASGAAGGNVTRAYYAKLGIVDAIPFRGGVAANTVAGTLAGWDLAYGYSRDSLGGKRPFARLLRDAVHYAEKGIPVTDSQSNNTRAKRCDLEPQPGFTATYLSDGTVPQAGSLFRQPRLGATLRVLANEGPQSFYRGTLARAIADDLAKAGSPVTLDDLGRHEAQWRTPLSLKHSVGTLYNMPAPTQGLVSLLTLGILDVLKIEKIDPNSADYIHLAVEAVKQAFGIRDRYITDPAYMSVDAAQFLDGTRIRALASRIDPTRAAPWGAGVGPGDTIWMGVIDDAGCAVSFIQSLYHEFGAGIVLADTGITWQNRGCSFSLRPDALNTLMPGRKPFHTLNPALAHFDDGRTMVYGNMGGDGQPQSQSAVFTRYALYGMSPQAAVSAPRWLLGRTWGQATDTLKLEARFPASIAGELRQRGHDVEVLKDFDETMGHAGAIVRHPNGTLEGGFDPRSDGAVAAF